MVYNDKNNTKTKIGSLYNSMYNKIKSLQDIFE